MNELFPTYQIRTVRDLLAIPPEKLRACLFDLAAWVDLVRGGEAIGAVVRDVPDQCGPDHFGWLDDGKHIATVTVTTPDDTATEAFDLAPQKPASEPNEIWCWAESADSEHWDHAGLTREEAIEYGQQAVERNAEGHYGYISSGTPVGVERAARSAVDAGQVLEQMDESDDVYGAFDEPVFELDGPRADAQSALEDAVAAWALKYVTANGKFTCGTKVEKVPAPPEASK